MGRRGRLHTHQAASESLGEDKSLCSYATDQRVHNKKYNNWDTNDTEIALIPATIAEVRVTRSGVRIRHQRDRERAQKTRGGI